MPLLPSDTVALVTGASRGAGAAIARALAREGAAVCVNYLSSAEKAQAVAADIEAAGGRAFTHQADVTDADAVQGMVDAVVERWGRVDVAVSNALPTYSFDPGARATPPSRPPSGTTSTGNTRAPSAPRSTSRARSRRSCASKPTADL